MCHAIIKSFAIRIWLLACIMTSTISCDTPSSILNEVKKDPTRYATIIADNPILRYFYEIESHKYHICDEIDAMDGRARAIIYHTHNNEYDKVQSLKNINSTNVVNIHHYLSWRTADATYCNILVTAFIEQLEHRFGTMTDPSFVYNQKALDVEKAALIGELTRIMVACPGQDLVTTPNQLPADLMYNMSEIARIPALQRACEKALRRKNS